MQTRPNRRSLFTASLALVIISASGLAGAAPEKTQKRDKDVLRGPDVTTTDRPAKQRDAMDSMDSMEERVDKSKKQANRPVLFRDYLTGMRQLKNSQALELSQPQQEQIKSILDDYREDMKLFQEKHQEKIKAMQAAILKAKTKKSSDTIADKIVSANDKKPQNENHIQARAKLRKFIDSAPANGKAISKLKQVLSPEQQTILKQKISDVRSKSAQRGQRPDQAQRRRGNDSEAERPSRNGTQRRNIDSDKVTRTQKDKSKRSKQDKPLTSDD